GITLAQHPTEHVRQELVEAGVLRLIDVQHQAGGSWLKVAGVVTHRQRPSTASGITFLSLEDESGQINVVCTASVWRKYHRVGRLAQALVVSGRLEKQDGALGIKAGHLYPLNLPVTGQSRDFQ
ncbi:MAG: OB-fold nucleic acid binding domain-containing protein, partial [Micrococcales bacterium]|nr:OB-fold nucleic acid binding domain-containing protein [Micrococcales bacterium]